MKLSTRGRYGIHAMYDLACNYNAGPQPIKAIAERQSIPEAYLEQLFAVLKRDKLVNSVRGAQDVYKRQANEAGIDMVIANGERPDIIYRILDGEPVGTRFIGRNAQ